MDMAHGIRADRDMVRVHGIQAGLVVPDTGTVLAVPVTDRGERRDIAASAKRSLTRNNKPPGSSRAVCYC
ncbi:hypothetical protein [Paenibacillus sp. MDMC362]|uniref:hypothetical protein n=1 Tax=Paenibacillus sp. MDMC362 TaxID=2977365 RepID=UPI0015EC55CF|nr:hypothetical protein [Paenibacillus sp. MDMC362]